MPLQQSLTATKNSISTTEDTPPNGIRLKLRGRTSLYTSSEMIFLSFKVLSLDSLSIFKMSLLYIKSFHGFSLYLEDQLLTQACKALRELTPTDSSSLLQYLSHSHSLCSSHTLFSFWHMPGFLI